jgi:DNA-binding XRE family transcriptional regulator
MCPYGKKHIRESMGHNQGNISKKPTYGKISTPEELGRIIRVKRKEIGVLQEAAAGIAGVGTKFLSQLENGKETAELGKTLQVLRKMGLEVYIFPRSADPFKER